jgi:hypothetical protein
MDALPRYYFGAILRLLFACRNDANMDDANMAQHGAGQLGEALDEVEPLGSEGKLEAACGLLAEPGFGLPGDMRGMIVKAEVDRGVAE